MLSNKNTKQKFFFILFQNSLLKEMSLGFNYKQNNAAKNPRQTKIKTQFYVDFLHELPVQVWTSKLSSNRPTGYVAMFCSFYFYTHNDVLWLSVGKKFLMTVMFCHTLP